MRGVVRNADVIFLYGLRLLCWCCCAAEIAASGGALDSGSTFHTRSTPLGASSGHQSTTEAPPAPPSPKISTGFSASLTDGLAQAVAHDAAQSSEFLLFSFVTQHCCFATPLVARSHLILLGWPLLCEQPKQTNRNKKRQAQVTLATDKWPLVEWTNCSRA